MRLDASGRPPDTVDVFASGGVVVRGGPKRPELLVVHRPRYDDWTLPKGKADPGENAAETALREVEEETALACRITGPGGATTYEVPVGTKHVEYFTMRPLWDFGFSPNEEVDRVRWVGFDAAMANLTYDHDRHLVSELAVSDATAATTLHLVRHAAAGSRSKWSGPDEERPLTEKGLRQAEVIAERLGSIGVERVLSSPYVRCVETVEPLAERLAVDVEHHPALAEGADPDAIAGLMDDTAGTTTVLCSHGDVIPDMLERLQRLGVRFRSEYACKKGSTWSVGHDGTRFTEAIYLPPVD